MPISFVLPLLVTTVGLFLLIRMKAFFLLHPIKTAKELFYGLKDRDARRSFFLALAGTLGVGNIFGVSAGIMIGGAGCLLWLFISSLFSAVIKYAEVLLAFDEKNGKIGVAGLLLRVFRNGKIISSIYAGLTVLLSLFMGAALQTAALCDIAYQTINTRPGITAAIMLVLLLPALLGGARKIESITEITIPLTTIIYITLCFAVIFARIDRLPEVISNILLSAFSFRSAAGGLTAIAVKEGFARGILSNEAGTGTSALAHSRSVNRSPHIAGLCGMCEVFFDTTVLCSLTGVAILSALDDFSSFKTPMSLVFAAFNSVLGELSVLLLPIIFAFAYSTIICWFYYGVEYCSVYFGGHKIAFLLLFIGFVLFSYVIPSSPLLYLTDLILLFMAFFTLTAIVKNTNRICFLSKNKELP